MSPVQNESIGYERDARQPEANRQPWPWGIGVVAESVELAGELSAALQEINAACQFRAAPSAPPFEIAALVGKMRPQVLFVELSKVEIPAQEWIALIRAGAETPLIIAVHANQDPGEMIAAMRAGATEFLSLPVRPAMGEALDRAATLLEARQTASGEPGKLIGVLSAKGGCGATTLACHLAWGLQLASGKGRVLLADLDHQSPGAHHIYRLEGQSGVREALDSVRRLNSACWPEFVRPASSEGMVDLLGTICGSGVAEPWRIESLFRFLRRNYTWILADLGRHLNPSNWTFFAHLDELLLVTAPDVPALYQTRAILQMLTNRGFEKSRVRLILNRNQDSPQDFWIESIEQMFDMPVTAVLPHDAPTLTRASAGVFEFPTGSVFGRSVTKLAGRIVQPKAQPNPQPRAQHQTPDSHRKSAA